MVIWAEIGNNCYFHGRWVVCKIVLGWATGQLPYGRVSINSSQFFVAVVVKDFVWMCSCQCLCYLQLCLYCREIWNSFTRFLNFSFSFKSFSWGGRPVLQYSSGKYDVENLFFLEHLSLALLKLSWHHSLSSMVTSETSWIVKLHSSNI